MADTIPARWAPKFDSLAASRSRALAKKKEAEEAAAAAAKTLGSPRRAAIEGAIGAGSALVAGALDANLPDVMPVRPSLILAIGAGSAAYALGKPKGVAAAAGVIQGHLYMAGLNQGGKLRVKWLGKKDAESAGAGE